MLDKKLIEELNERLAPKSGEAHQLPELTHMRKVALSTLGQYQNANDKVTEFNGRPIRSNAEAVINRRSIQAFQMTMQEELGRLASHVTDISHLDGTMVDLSDRLNIAVAAQARVIV